MSKQDANEWFLCANCNLRVHLSDQHQCGIASNIIKKKQPELSEEEQIFSKLLRGQLDYNEIDKQTIINFMEYIKKHEPRVAMGMEKGVSLLYLNAWKRCKEILDA